MLLCESAAEVYKIRVLLGKTLSIIAKYKQPDYKYLLSFREAKILERTNNVLSQIHLADVFLKAQKTPSDLKNIPTGLELFLVGCWYKVIIRSSLQLDILELQNYLKNMDGKVARDQGQLLISVLGQMRNELEQNNFLSPT